MINCVSRVVPPARSICTDTQLISNQRGADSILSNYIYNIIIFINRFMQCGQNTVVSLMGSIQHCIFLKTGRIFYTSVDDLPCSDRIIHAVQNERDNHHDNLAKVRKSEKNLQYSDLRNMIEADMCNNCNNFNNDTRRKIPLREEKQTISKIRNYIIVSFYLTEKFFIINSYEIKLNFYIPIIFIFLIILLAVPLFLKK